MKTLSLIAVSACLSFGVAHALTISGQAPIGAEKISVSYELTATKKIPLKCTHYNLFGPIFNGGEPHGWNINRVRSYAEALVDHDGNYTVEIDYTKLAKSICRFEIRYLTISTDATDQNPALQVQLIPSKDATETSFNFDASLPFRRDIFLEKSDVLEVNF